MCKKRDIQADAMDPALDVQQQWVYYVQQMPGIGPLLRAKVGTPISERQPVAWASNRVPAVRARTSFRSFRRWPPARTPARPPRLSALRALCRDSLARCLAQSERPRRPGGASGLRGTEWPRTHSRTPPGGGKKRRDAFSDCKSWVFKLFTEHAPMHDHAPAQFGPVCMQL